jgi:hypothetical protein
MHNTPPQPKEKQPMTSFLTTLITFLATFGTPNVPTKDGVTPPPTSDS